MSAKRMLFVGVVLVTSCRRAEVDIPNPPESATHMAVLVHDVDGRRLASTPLFSAREPPPPMELLGDPGGDAVVEVVAYEQLDPLVDPAGVTIAPVRRALETEALLAPPSVAWTRRLADDAYVQLEDPSGVEITSDALGPCPPRLPRDAFVDLSCFFATCPVQARQVGCRVKLDALECGITIDVLVDARGRIEGACSERVDGPPRGTLSLSCRDCVADMYAGPFEPLAVVTTRAVVDVDTPWRFQQPPIVGHLTGLAVLDDRLVTGRHDAPHDLVNCNPNRPARFEFLDLDTLETIATATAPACLADIVADGRGGFVVLHGGANPEVTRYDATGRALETLLLFDDDAPLSHRPMWMVRNDGGFVAMLPNVIDEGALHGFRLASFEVAPMRVTLEAIEDDADVRPASLSALPGARVAFSDLPDNGVFIYATDGSGALDLFTETRAHLGGGSQRVEFVTYSEAADRLVASVQAEPNLERRWGGVHILELAGGPTGIGTPFAKTFERRTDASASFALPSGHVLVMLTDIQGVSYVGVADPEKIRFLPGMVPVDSGGKTLGMATVVTGDGEVLYAVHPSSGHVTRIVVSPTL